MDIYQTRINVFNAANQSCSETRTYEIALNNTVETLELLVSSIESFIKEAGVDRKLLVGIGVSMPGLVDSRKGVNRTYLQFDGPSLKDVLEDRIKLPVFIENDAKAIALSVWRDGVAKGKKDVLVLFLDWGIGLGMILDGKLYRGASGFAGEFSHIPIVENGELCICGKLGCLQTLGAGTALVKKAKEGLKEGKSSLLAKEELGTLSLHAIVDAALRGDQFAINLFAEIGKNLGKGISILIQLFNPEQIVIGGKMAEVGQYLTMPIQQAINTYSMSQISGRVTIELSRFGKDIGLNGALAVVMSEVFDYMQKHHH
ncbi:ROK family protein [Geofilum rubicundum]|uniref:Glucokinase n=1 Tax=Geofilum rubicundum JCM 15548 TaxID=1236989 RepID=A0A0E9LYX7_9BACT|nr:ROK family protein [Geofilum rubicundum]GAO30070.1 glucokinase [Geofilum rubicundum JCM 15548]